MSAFTLLAPNRFYRCPCGKMVQLFLPVDEHDDSKWPKPGEVFCGDCDLKAQEWGDRRKQASTERFADISQRLADLRL